jgi:CTP:molybdopterin cytidylyltransferase MocA
MSSAERASRVLGLVLAAGEGSRLGMPKALVTDDDGVSWLVRAIETLTAGGTAAAYAVVGAASDRVRELAPAGVTVVEAVDWSEGMGASLRTGLSAVVDAELSADAALVLLVDTPGVGSGVVRRMIDRAAPDALARATYNGVPGHPVLIGRDHWAGVIESAGGDRGARDYLSAHGVVDVECGDLADGTDIDTPDALEAWQRRGQPT